MALLGMAWPATSTSRRGAVALIVASMVMAGCGHADQGATRPPKPSSGASQDAAIVGEISLDPDAPSWCKSLVAEPVTQMAVDLPDVALGAAGATSAVEQGAQDLRAATDSFPDSIATAARTAADALSAYVKAPKDRQRLNRVLSSLQDLGAQAHKECGL